MNIAKAFRLKPILDLSVANLGKNVSYIWIASGGTAAPYIDIKTHKHAMRICIRKRFDNVALYNNTTNYLEGS